jgi:archaellum component FlaC
VIEGEPRSDWVFGLSLVQVLLLLGFAMMIIYVTDSVEGGGQESHQAVETRPQDANLQARLNADAEKNDRLEKQLGDMTLLIDELKLMVGAKVPSREAFQEAIENLKRGYALCQKDNNTLIDASIQNGVEAIHVIGEIPSELEVSLLKGDQTSDLDQIVSFVQDVYQYEKDHKCRFNYRLKYGTDNDYRKAREAYEKYFYPEKITRTG